MALYEIVILIATIMCIGVMVGRASKPNRSVDWYEKGGVAMAKATERRFSEYKELTDTLTMEIASLRTKAETAYKQGWEESKQVYYIDLREDRRAEEQRIRSELETENREFCPITSELLMAYGVTKVGDLPKQVKDAYKIPDSLNQMDLDTMIQAETGGAYDE